eukprot:9918386-Karenia_brevis.AAC.1
MGTILAGRHAVLVSQMLHQAGVNSGMRCRNFRNLHITTGWLSSSAVLGDVCLGTACNSSAGGGHGGTRCPIAR